MISLGGVEQEERNILGQTFLVSYAGVAAAGLQCAPMGPQHRSEACLLRYLSVDEGEFGANAGTRA